PQPKLVLDRLMAESHEHTVKALDVSAHQFADKFKKEYGLEVMFDDSALRRLVERAQTERMMMAELCAHLFKDYQFGLSLIQKNSGQKKFVLNAEAVDAPDKFLSDLVVRSYYPVAPAQKA